MSKTRLQIGIGISVLVSAVVLYFVMRDINWADAWTAIRAMRPLGVVGGVIFFSLGLLARGLRWGALLRGELSLKRVLNLTNIAFFINNVLPFRAGDIARIEAAAHGDDAITRATALSVAVVERLIDLITLMVVFAITISLLPDVPTEVQQSVFGFGVLTLVLSVAVLLVGTILQRWTRRLVERVAGWIPLISRLGLDKFADNVLDALAVVGSPRYLLLALFWNVVAWTCSTYANIAIVNALYDTFPLGVVLLMIVATAFAISVPVTIASIGAIQAGVVIAMTSQGYPAEEALAIGIVLHVATLISYTILGTVSLWLETLSLATVWQDITDEPTKGIEPT